VRGWRRAAGALEAEPKGGLDGKARSLFGEKVGRRGLKINSYFSRGVRGWRRAGGGAKRWSGRESAVAFRRESGQAWAENKLLFFLMKIHLFFTFFHKKKYFFAKKNRKKHDSLSTPLSTV
jgi:hypothetical protein